MYSGRDDAALPAPGFPIRKSAGQRLFSTSPRLIAAVHVLHRLLVPRHPPCALTILTVIRVPKDPVISPRVPPREDPFLFGQQMRFSRTGEGATRGLRAGLSKLNSTGPARLRASSRLGQLRAFERTRLIPDPVDISRRRARIRAPADSCD